MIVYYFCGKYVGLYLTQRIKIKSSNVASFKGIVPIGDEAENLYIACMIIDHEGDRRIFWIYSNYKNKLNTHHI